MTGRSSSRTHSRPSTFGCTIASVKGRSRTRWIRYRIERTGSTRAQPRSLAGGGTTAPASAHVCGRGVSQCQALRTRMTSPNAPPAALATRVSGASEYQAISGHAAVDLACGLRAGGALVEGHHGDLEALVLPERDEDRRTFHRDRELDRVV